jgi:type III secretory pathway component EscU
MLHGVPASEKALGTTTLLLFSLVLFFQATRYLSNASFYLASIITVLVGFLSFVFVQTVFAGKTSSSLPFLSFNTILLATIIFAKQIPVTLITALLISTILGLFVSSLRIYRKIKIIKQLKTYNKSTEINKELDDEWNEEPHIIYDEQKK